MKHESGVLLERMGWPFPTAQERILLAKWYAKRDRQRILDEAGEALF